MKNMTKKSSFWFNKWLVQALSLIIASTIGIGVAIADNSVPVSTDDHLISGNAHFNPTSSIRLPSIDNHCMGDVATANGISGLTCTANDIDIAEPFDIEIISGDPNPDNGLDECTIGEDVTFTAKFKFELSAQARHDLGVWFATAGQTDARNGACLVSTAPIFYSSEGTLNDLDGQTTGVCSNDSTLKCDANSDCKGKNNTCSYKQDFCGDIDDASSPQYFEIEITTACVDKDRDGNLDLPVCLSWRQPGADEYCEDAEDAYPGSPSKCNCDDTFSVPIIVPTPQLQVFKSISPTTIIEPGGTATVTFDIINPSLYGNDVDISNIIDELDDYVIDSSAGTPDVSSADFDNPDDTIILYDDIIPSSLNMTCVQYQESYSATPSSSPVAFDPSNDLLMAQEDGTFDPTVLSPNFVRCTFSRFVGGEKIGPDTGFFFDLITVSGVDENGGDSQGQDDAGLQIIDKPPLVSLTKTANPTTLTEQQIANGNTNITYTVEIKVPLTSDILTIDCLDDMTNVGTSSTGSVATYTCGTGSSLLNDITGSPTCASLNGKTLAPGGTATCTFIAAAIGISDTGEVLHDRVVVKVSDDEGGTASAGGIAMVTVTNSPPSLKLTKTGAPTISSVDYEPSYMATYTYIIKNITTFDDIVVLDKLEDTITLVDGTTLATDDITATCKDSSGDTILTAPVELAKGETFTCTVSRTVGLDASGDSAGDAPGLLPDVGNTEDNLAKITGHEKGLTGDITATDTESLGFRDKLPSANIKKQVYTLLVTYKVTVSNTSNEALDLTALTDSVGGVAVDITDSTYYPDDSALDSCDTSGVFELAKQNTGNSDDYICYFSRKIVTDGSTPPVTNIVTATAVDDEGNEVTPKPTAKAQVAWVSNYIE